MMIFPTSKEDATLNRPVREAAKEEQVYLDKD